MKSYRSGLGLVLLALLGACRDADIADLERTLSGLRVDPDSVTLEPLPDLPESVSVAYLFDDRRSPFRAPGDVIEDAVEPDSDEGPDVGRSREPLEAFPLDQLMLVGTLTFSGRTSALVRDPEGIVHRVHVGNHLGADFGRIVKISGDAVQLREVVSTDQGGWVQRINRLILDG